jgi:phosphoribosylformimino-5-aminoimidazole carboxamide ribotide isomerase
MIILPAIDLRGGRCVRLRQGRYDDETVFDEDPVAVARRFEAAGAKWLHVVDLDGARAGAPQNLDTVRQIVEAIGMEVQVGGGIRTTGAAGTILQMGAGRVIVGTRALREPAWLGELAGEFPGRIALGLDARGGCVAVEGWESQTARTAADVLASVRGLALAAIIYTDIARDGMMAGPNIEATAEVVSATRFPVIASGGVTTVDDVKRLKAAGVAGAIIGRALYEGRITLEAALAAAGE